MNWPQTPVRLTLVVLLWTGCAALGWWLHEPKTLVDKSSKPATQAAPRSPQVYTDLSKDPLWSQLSAQDPFGLKRDGPQAAAAPQGAASDAIVWNFAALSVGRDQRSLVMTAAGQTPLLLKEGDKLPNGERIKSIHTNRVQLQDSRGRKRTIQLIEP